MRAIVWDVEHDATPPAMTICIPGRPHRFARITIDRAGATREETLRAAIAQVSRAEELLVASSALAGRDRRWEPGELPKREGKRTRRRPR